MRFILAFLFAGAVVCSVEAQIYQWKDKDGNIRFSDQPPPDHPDAQGASTAISSETKSSSAVAGNERRRRRGGELLDALPESRAAILETIRYRIVDSELEESIGKRYTSSQRNFNQLKRAPADCSFGATDPLTTTYANDVLSKGKRPTQLEFHRLLKRQGYSVADNSESVFANQESAKAELSIAAVIRKADYTSCATMRSSRDSFDKANLTVEWQVFDNLAREVIYTVEASGEGSTYNDEADYYSRARAFERAIMDSAQVPLQDPAFRDALALTNELQSDVANQEALTNVNVNRGSSKQSFVERSADIERGTVTVRTAGGHGSGFFVSSDGFIVTNAHVVEGSKRVLIVTTEEELFGDVVRQDPMRDVALVKVVGGNNYPLTISTKDVRIGEQIYAVGTPLSEELSFSVTRGIISGKRSINGMPLLQTDAAINPGNSGGPVLNENGDVVAVSVSGIFSKSGGSLNTNFVIPIDDALEKLGL